MKLLKSIAVACIAFIGGMKSNKIYGQIVYSGQQKVYAIDPSKRPLKKPYREKVDYTNWKELLKRNVTVRGGVNYKGFKYDSKKFNDFLASLSVIRIDNTWTIKDQIAFWINVYNAYTVKLIVNYYPVNSIKEINDPWNKKFLSINGKLMSLSEVEHEILRKFGDPRIHFAINCASASCPRLIRIPYTSENLDRLLERQTEEFINDPFHNTITGYTVNISKLFDWYKKDFKDIHGSVINFINQYSKIPIANQKEKGYKPYDWSITNIISKF